MLVENFVSSTSTESTLIKEEKDIEEALKKLLDEENIDEQSFQKMKPIGSKAPRLYGLAKVHKKHIPLRPVLSMPGSPYYNIGKFLSQYLARVPECNIQTSTEEISNKIKNKPAKLIRTALKKELIKYCFT